MENLQDWKSAKKRYVTIRNVLSGPRRKKPDVPLMMNAISSNGSEILGIPPCDFCKKYMKNENERCPWADVFGKCAEDCAGNGDFRDSAWMEMQKSIWSYDYEKTVKIVDFILADIEKKITGIERTIVEKWTPEQAKSFIKGAHLMLDHYHYYTFFFKSKKNGYTIQGKIGGEPDDIRGETILPVEIASNMWEIRVVNENGIEVFIDASDNINTGSWKW